MFKKHILEIILQITRMSQDHNVLRNRFFFYFHCPHEITLLIHLIFGGKSAFLMDIVVLLVQLFFFLRGCS